MSYKGAFDATVGWFIGFLVKHFKVAAADVDSKVSHPFGVANPANNDILMYKLFVFISIKIAVGAFASHPFGWLTRQINEILRYKVENLSALNLKENFSHKSNGA